MYFYLKKNYIFFILFYSQILNRSTKDYIITTFCLTDIMKNNKFMTSKIL